MRISPDELSQRMDRFKECLKGSGVKITYQRLEIFREVAASGDHPDAESIFRKVRKRLPTVSLDTVYRTLWLLMDLGLLTTLGTSRDRTRFDANMRNHHHFVCSRCGLTRDFHCDNFDQLEIPDSVREFGKAEKTQVEIRGVCLACQENRGKV